ncbi:MAG: bifunctional phosphopantothenoylcysteine decarboxylase/phosphopantothenate--cysteine ligase CoaBC [Candidatus Dormibacteria bacterium]
MTDEGSLAGRRIALLLSGGIAVVKVPELVTRLRKAGAEVRVGLTPTAARLIPAATLRALSGHPVHSRLLPRGPLEGGDDDGHGMVHLDLAHWADTRVVAPATASTLARLAVGLAEDVVSATVLAGQGPLLLAPAMEAHMWRQPATQANLRLLCERGATVVGPVAGRLASGALGEGRMAEPKAIVEAIRALGRASSSMAGWKVLVTAGATREPIDPVRYLSNRSSGRMGRALAAAAQARGAQVALVTAAPGPQEEGVEVVPVETATEMLAACTQRLPSLRLLLMAAAVADFRPQHPSPEKLHRAGQETLELHLVANPDLLQQLVRERPPDCITVGFAAETGDLAAAGRAKLRQKGCDLIVANPVTGEHSAMGGEMAEAVLVFRDRPDLALPWQPKRQLAEGILDQVERLVPGGVLPPTS